MRLHRWYETASNVTAGWIRGVGGQAHSRSVAYSYVIRESRSGKRFDGGRSDFRCLRNMSEGTRERMIASDFDYQEHILQGVSRTFALTIPQLPGGA